MNTLQLTLQARSNFSNVCRRPTEPLLPTVLTDMLLHTLTKQGNEEKEVIFRAFSFSHSQQHKPQHSETDEILAFAAHCAHKLKRSVVMITCAYVREGNILKILTI